ncbi:hypothetical protein [Streptomyces sp. NPDC048106]|uniref:hypothetical protein n=1 Tax=Streptomyces sp. NPDC048106 TaxID=3155750 RepID=UPI003452A2AC
MWEQAFREGPLTREQPAQRHQHRRVPTAAREPATFDTGRHCEAAERVRETQADANLSSEERAIQKQVLEWLVRDLQEAEERQ